MKNKEYQELIAAAMTGDVVKANGTPKLSEFLKAKGEYIDFAIGYALYAMEALDYTQEQINAFIFAMQQQLDKHTPQEAQEHYDMRVLIV